MIRALPRLWLARSPRERQAWLAALVLAVAVGCLALAGAALQARAPLQRDVDRLRAESARMDQQAREIEQLRRLPATAAPGEALPARVQRALDASAAAGLARLDAPDPAQVVLVFEAVAFADWLALLDDLAARQVRLEACRVEALPGSGQVRVNATLVAAGPP